jgi:hypothetical protein
MIHHCSLGESGVSQEPPGQAATLKLGRQLRLGYGGSRDCDRGV